MEGNGRERLHDDADRAARLDHPCSAGRRRDRDGGSRRSTGAGRSPQVCLDPVRGLITLMSPSRLHDDLAEILSHIVDTAGSAVTGASKGLRTTRLRGQGEPPGTGMEPDCAFYVGARAPGLSGGDRRERGGRRRVPGTHRAGSRGRGGDHQPRRGARSNATPGWACGNCGGCTVDREPATCRWDFLALRIGMPPRPIHASGRPWRPHVR